MIPMGEQRNDDENDEPTSDYWLQDAYEVPESHHDIGAVTDPDPTFDGSEGHTGTYAIDEGTDASVTIPVDPPDAVPFDEAMDGVLALLDDFGYYVENNEVGSFQDGFETARDIVRTYHLRKSASVDCACPDGPEPEKDTDGFWVCAECAHCLMTPSADAATGPDAGPTASKRVDDA